MTKETAMYVHQVLSTFYVANCVLFFACLVGLLIAQDFKPEGSGVIKTLIVTAFIALFFIIFAPNPDTAKLLLEPYMKAVAEAAP